MAERQLPLPGDRLLPVGEFKHRLQLQRIGLEGQNEERFNLVVQEMTRQDSGGNRRLGYCIQEVCLTALHEREVDGLSRHG